MAETNSGQPFDIGSFGQRISRSAGLLLVFGVLIILYSTGTMRAGTFSTELNANIPQTLRVVIVGLGCYICIVALALIVIKQTPGAPIWAWAFISRWLVWSGIVGCLVLVAAAISLAAAKPIAGIVPDLFFDPISQEYEVVFQSSSLAPYEGQSLVLAVQREESDDIDTRLVDRITSGNDVCHVVVKCTSSDLRLGEKLFCHLVVVPPGSNLQGVKSISQLNAIPGAKDLLTDCWQKVSIKEPSAKGVMYIYQRLCASEQHEADSQIAMYKERLRLQQAMDK